MRVLPGFLLRIFKPARHSDEGRAGMAVVIRRPYAYLEEELRRVFEGQDDVQAIVDRRYLERRAGRQYVAVEQRQVDRRTPKEVLVEVAM